MAQDDANHTLAKPNTRPVVWGVVAGFVICATLIAAVLTQSARSRDLEAQILHTLTVKRQAQEVLSILQDAETGQRGFLLTGSRAYLAPYSRARETFEPAVAALSDSVTDKPAQQALLRDILAEGQLKLAELQATVSLMMDGDRDAALDIVATDEGLRLMSGLRENIARFIAVEDMALADRIAASRAAEGRMTRGLVGALFAIIALSVFTFLLTRRNLAAVETQRRALADLNADLDARVRARTSELGTALAEAEHERDRVELLIREVDHRVGNSLSMISSLLGMERRTTTSPEAARIIDAARGRIRALGAAQRHFKLVDNLTHVRVDEALRNLVDDIDASGQAKDITFDVQAQPLSLEGRDAVTMAVITNELITNALKHAFGDGAGGRITVEFTANADEMPVLSVTDDGSGWQIDGTEQGMGSKVIAMLASHLGGETSVTQASGGGTRVAITFYTLAVSHET
ncbi:sensor histidine kinase [Pseudaestuariivita atlantica]|uniref:histidine kinase n=1 Tax=Pseudaestuariivita atlantica TaxID=1317121 RepID=A0A0L1JQC5_9RHOB|nr:CHASE3 domain-containing protein [Pseudaestuariivita atlantica]KNG93969.1 hypothetical protein ATO11_06795 [Pseudaestuariivita atlantica]